MSSLISQLLIKSWQSLAQAVTISAIFSVSNVLAATSSSDAANNWQSQCGSQIALADSHYQGCYDELQLNGSDDAVSISATSYLMASNADRPVMFLFNGGPGSSSSMLHFDGVGPKQKQRDAAGNNVLVDNPNSLLSQVDLVFIDPPGTGFTEAPDTEAARLAYWSSDGDAAAFCQFIQRWLTQHKRTDAKVYIAGESYGGYRLALMSKSLTSLNIGGLMFISPLLNASDTDESPGNVLTYLLGLPSMAVAAATHNKGSYKGQPAARIFDKVSDFSYQVYGPALLQGRNLPQAQLEQVAAQMAAILGLDVKLLIDKQLKLGAEDYRNLLLLDENQVFGRLDSRVLAPLPPSNKDRPSALDDPALGLKGGLEIKSTLYADYLRQLTGIKREQPYKALNLNINFHWQFAPHREGFESLTFYFNPTNNLADFVASHPNTKLLVLAGYYDLAVPALALKYALDQSDIPYSNLKFAILNSGHSVFSDTASRTELVTLLQEFLQ